MASPDDDAPRLHITVDFVLVHVAVKRPTEIGRSAQFLVPTEHHPRLVTAERLDTVGWTVDASGGSVLAATQWLVKIYRVGTSGGRRELRALLNRQTAAIQQINAAPHDDLSQWAVAPAYLAHALGPAGAAPRTRLGADPEKISDAIDPRIAAWFPGEGTPAPHLCVAVLSRDLPGRITRPYIQIPSPTGLPALGRIAAGLTRLHESGFAHCDVAPSNLRKGPREQLVLVDLDSIVGTSDAPHYIRAQYFHPEVALRQAQNATLSTEKRTGIPKAELIAQDWYGLVLTVLAELAGDQWVASKFGSVDGQQPISPSGAEVEAGLMQLWRGDEQWRPLARAAAAPFEKPRAALMLDPSWSSIEWLEHLRVAAAEREVGPPSVPDEPFARELRDFRRRTQGPVAVKTEGRDRVLAVAWEMSRDISWLAARRWIRLAALILVLVYVVALAVALGERAA